jgi:hypothetical protein
MQNDLMFIGGVLFALEWTLLYSEQFDFFNHRGRDESIKRFSPSVRHSVVKV